MIFLAWAICMFLIVKVVTAAVDKQEQNSKELDR